MLGSVFFYLGNLLGIGLLLFVPLTWLSLPFYAIALVLAFPAIGALADLLKDQSWSTEFVLGLRKYAKYWRKNFKTYLKIGVLYAFVFVFLFLDMYAVNVIMKSSLFTPVVLLISLLALISLGWIVAIQAYFKIDVKNSLRLMAYALPRYALHSLLIIALLFLLYMSLSFIPQFMVFIIAPVALEG
ncbi:DUF624 domain-containing protein [Lacticaseibacillus nasuensis]|uniref:DUF624 domain-containing protein n=1 Tax=Lacticaseibacillus nasuensis TaxID=944671 RepID=UPI0006D15F36|nr:DUF624 domain-containing protein [Lacticaseibacillus nasuensis]